MAYGILYDIVTEAESYDRKYEMKILWEAYKQHNETGKTYLLLDWLNDVLDNFGIPRNNFRECYIRGLMNYSDELESFMEHIWQKTQDCQDESDSESEGEKEDEKDAESE